MQWRREAASVSGPSGRATSRSAWTSARDKRTASAPGRSGLQRCAQVADVRAHAGQRLEAEAARDELEDRCRVVGRVVDVAALDSRADDQRRNARPGAELVAPART